MLLTYYGGKLGELDGLRLPDGLWLADGLFDALDDFDALADGERLALGLLDPEGEGD